MPKEKEYKYTKDDLSAMQAWPLERKIRVTNPADGVENKIQRENLHFIQRREG